MSDATGRTRRASPGKAPFTTLREGSLHAALKAMYAGPGDEVEALVDGHVVDVVRAGELVEVQTASFASMRRKLEHLVEAHRVLLVHPIPVERLIVRVDADGVLLSRRRSPRRGLPIDLFDELVSFPALLDHSNFELEVVLVREEELRGPIPPGVRFRYPREWWRLDRRLLEVTGTIRVRTPADLLGLLPPGLPEPFTTADIVAATRRTRRIAMRAAYCLEKAGVARCVGRRGRLRAYETVAEAAGTVPIAATSSSPVGDNVDLPEGESEPGPGVPRGRPPAPQSRCR